MGKVKKICGNKFEFSFTIVTLTYDEFSLSLVLHLGTKSSQIPYTGCWKSPTWTIRN
jgi:hypothetical protein